MYSKARSQITPSVGAGTSTNIKYMKFLPCWKVSWKAIMTSPKYLEERRAALEIYLSTVLAQEMYREQGDVVIQYFSFVDDLTTNLGNHCHLYYT